MGKVAPDAYKAMDALDTFVDKSSISPLHKELIKIRASQINGCAFCIDMHTKEALAVGETQQRIFVMSAWRETNLFTEEEKIILKLTEEVTLIHDKGVTDETYAQATKFFSAETIAEIIMAVVTINAWNRLAVSTHTQIN